MATTAPPRETSIGQEYATISAYFDRFAPVEQRWRRRNRTYHGLVERIARFHVPPDAKVLEIGSGAGDLLAALDPSVGVGVDVSPGMVALARRRHPHLRFEVAAGEALDLGETFDYIVLSDLVPFVHDLLALFARVAAHAHPRTRIVIHSYSRLWRPVIRLAELLRLKPRKPIRNWVTPDDVSNLLELSGLETVTTTARILLPKGVPLVSWFLNGVLANVWPFNRLCLTYWIVGRTQASELGDQTVSVVCPCRNEEGHVAEIVRRLPSIGLATELIFVEGGSTDGTRAEIGRQIELHPDRAISLVDQPGQGKGDAVRAGFAAARDDVLLILDGDLSVRPEDLPGFYRALVDGHAELVNGSRLV